MTNSLGSATSLITCSLSTSLPVSNNLGKTLRWKKFYWRCRCLLKNLPAPVSTHSHRNIVLFFSRCRFCVSNSRKKIICQLLSKSHRTWTPAGRGPRWSAGPETLWAGESRRRPLEELHCRSSLFPPLASYQGTRSSTPPFPIPLPPLVRDIQAQQNVRLLTMWNFISLAEVCYGAIRS